MTQHRSGSADDWMDALRQGPPPGGGSHDSGPAAPGGTSQYGGSQYGGSQYGGSQYGGSQYGGSQYGGASYYGADAGGPDRGGYGGYGGHGTEHPGGQRGGYSGAGLTGGYDGDRLGGMYGGREDGGYGAPAVPDGGPAMRPTHAGGAPPGGVPPAGPGRRRRGRRLRRILGAIALAVLLLVVGGITVLYLGVKVPQPNQLATAQISTIAYSDGSPIAKVGAQNRTDVPLTKVPEHVRSAVLAAENRTFYTDPGISARGILRAAWNNVRGGDVQGGSGITQQYVKNMYLTQERTLTRKFKELAIAVKVDRDYSKDQILEWYLNTIYFGRGAYGIEAAAQTYFGKSVGKLSVAEGAVLAASIRSPALYDPQAHPEAAKARWTFVLDGLVEMGKLSRSQVDAMKYPRVRPKAAGMQNDLAGPNGLIVQQVQDELARNGFDEATLNAKGLTVITSIDRTAQNAAVAAVRQVFAGQPPALRQALVAVDPGSGKVLAYYGGAKGGGFDYAQSWRPPGSSFKPYTFAAALQQTVQPTGDAPSKQISVYTRFNGTSPRDFNGVQVRNSGDAQCPNCTVLEAMKRSVNTVFYDMAIQVGPRNVADTAHRMGVPAKDNRGRPTLQKDGVTDGSIGIGRYEIRPIDQAVGFSVFAAGGQLHQPYFVQKVLDRGGKVLYEHKAAPRQVLDPKVANDVTYSMKPIAEWSHDPLTDGRPSAAKTGTQQFGETEDNSDAWMVGFTPQISTAVWVGQDRPGPIRNKLGRPIYGAGLPGQTWQAFMDAYLSGKPVQPLPNQIMVNAQQAPATPAPVTASHTSTTAAPTTTPPKTTRPAPTTTPPTTTPVPTPSITLPPVTSPAPTRSRSPKPTP